MRSNMKDVHHPNGKANHNPPSEPRVKAARTFKDEQRAAERVTLRRASAGIGPHSEKTVGELLQRLFDEDGHRNPDILESVVEQVVQDLYTLGVCIEMGNDALDDDAISIRLARLRSKLEIGVELARRDRAANSGSDEAVGA
jgi:hypothetical protein